MLRIRQKHPGNITVLAALLMVVLLAVVALAVDVGMLYIGRTELQRTADASAMAAAWELLESNAQAQKLSPRKLESRVRSKARQFAELNSTQAKRLRLGSEDVELGYMSNPSNPASTFETGAAQPKNSVRVVVQRSEQRNGQLPLFFARVLGFSKSSVAAEATASANVNFNGFQPPSDGSNLPLLPFALDQETWQALLSGNGKDEYRYDPKTKTVSPGKDGIREFNLYPQDTGSAGNRGTVDIGNSNNSTADLARQITGGITAADLDHVGGRLEFNDQGKLYLNGDTGLSASLGKSLAKIEGQPRMVPVFSQVEGSGNNATYTIVEFVGIRIMQAELTSGDKRLIVQPAAVVTLGGIPSDSPHTDFIYSPVRLVR